jgi:large subunit ribosomal protein L24
MARIRKGDMVTVLSGKDKGKSGKVLQLWPARDRALVEKINVMKHFDRPTQRNQAGGIVARETPIQLSKLTLSCNKCQRPVRVAWTIAADGSKSRVCGKCKQPL